MGLGGAKRWGWRGINEKCSFGSISDTYLKMINYKVSKTCHVQFPFLLTLTWGPDIVFKKLNIANCFFFNIFSEDLYFNALIIGLFYICLVTDQILGESTL